MTTDRQTAASAAGSPSGAPRPYYADDFVTLYHGDCREVEAWREAAVLVTDPPYGIAYRSNAPGKRGRVRSIANDADTSTRDAALEAWGDRPALVFGSWKRTKPAATRMVLYWDTKGALGMGDLSLPWKNSTQEIYVLGRGFHGRRGGNVLRFPPVQAISRNHPHEKPVDLMLAILQRCPAGVVADPFAGSGATLVAAKLLGRRAVGVELNAAQCATIARRLSQETLNLGGAA